MRIAVDAMGGDFAPREVVEGAILAQTQLGVDIALVGDRDILANYLKQHNYQESDHLEIVPSEGIIEMDDEPLEGLRRKPNSSIAVAMNLVKRKQADAVVSAGHSGAAMAAALLRLGRLPGVDRPAIGALFPTQVPHKPVLILDVGANIGNWSRLVNSQLTNCEIYAFEPSRETFLALAEFANDEPNIHIHNFGCGERDASQNLYYDELKSGMASLSKRDLRHLNIDFEEFESVDIRRLDTFLSDLSLKPDAVKIDVEGHELAVLKGLGDLICGFKVIQFEFGGTDIDSRIFFRDFWTFFESKKFDLYRLSPKGKIRVASYQETDEVFSFSTYFAIAKIN